MLLLFMHNPTHNFLSWYKACCNADFSLYRNTIYKKNKAIMAYKILSNFDFSSYPLDGSENIFYGSKSACEDYMQQNPNIKFSVFSKKGDSSVNYIIQNEKVKIID